MFLILIPWNKLISDTFYCYSMVQKQIILGHSDPEIKKTGINSFFLVLNHLYSNPIQNLKLLIYLIFQRKSIFDTLYLREHVS
jgi:hypothetical protein